MGEDQNRRSRQQAVTSPVLSAVGVGEIAELAEPDRQGVVRATAWHGGLAPAVTIVYAATTWDQANRPALLALSVFLLATIVVASVAAPALAHRPRFAKATLAGVFLHVAGYAGLAYLDGGVAGPLGPLVFFLMTFVAITVPFRFFVPVAVASMGAYAVVAVFGPAAPRWFALINLVGFPVLSAVLLRHARALRSLRRRLTEISRMDPLTNCLNRRGFDERLADEVSRSDRTGRPFSVIMVDLDSFKAVNDTFGHHIGDEVLRWTGQALKETLPLPHAVARLGGDEFAVILPDVDPAAASDLADRCRLALDDASPASMGTASYPTEATDPERLQGLADRRLYVDKEARAGAADPVRTPQLSAQLRNRAARPVSTPLTVSSAERRQRSITDIGWIASINFGIGTAYAMTASGARNGWLLAALVPGFVMSVAALLTAARIVRRRRAALVWNIVGPLLFVLAQLAAALDGGVSSVISLGTMTPLIVVSLTLPRRAVVKLAGGVAASYLAQAVLIGAPGGWFTALNLAGILVVSGACAHQGQVAARGRRLLTRLSRVDGLTGCLNRRGFEERFDEELLTASRDDAPLSVAIVDLDRFKAVNDTLGHAAGDDLLCWVGATLRDITRGHDIIGRLGGDEFIALLPGCPAAEAAVIADRFATALLPRTRVSVGTGTLGRDGDDLDSLYRHADSLLYEDKARHVAARDRQQQEADRQAQVQSAAERVARTRAVTPRPLRLL